MLGVQRRRQNDSSIINAMNIYNSKLAKDHFIINKNSDYIRILNNQMFLLLFKVCISHTSVHNIISFFSMVLFYSKGNVITMKMCVFCDLYFFNMIKPYT